jgi:predicted acylesterase/phospholipase RssA
MRVLRLDWRYEHRRIDCDNVRTTWNGTTLPINHADPYYQNVDECIDTFLKISREVFTVDKVLLQEIPIGDNQCRFDYKILERALQSMINDRLKSENYTMSEISNAPHPVRPTFVVSKMALHTDGPPTVFRSYFGDGVQPSKCAIWQAARATCAAPTFFKEMFIDNPLPGITYVDGGLGYNNPSEVALDEARRIWPTSKQFCLVSVGAGRQKPIRIIEGSKVRIIDGSNLTDDINTQRTLFKHVKSFFPRIVSLVPGWETVKRFPSGVLALMRMASAISDLTTNSEQVHQRLLRNSRAADINKQFPYFRFNVEREMGDIGFEDWAKEEEMATHTAAYLGEHEVEELKMKCVEFLLNPPEFKRKIPFFHISDSTDRGEHISHRCTKVFYGAI